MSKIRLALVGAGVIGKRHLLAIGSVPDIELMAIADAAPAAKEVAGEASVPLYKDLASLLAECRPDGVIVATPTEHHFEPTCCALENGVPVLVEKPVMATLEEAHRIVELSAAKGCPVLVGHQRRYYGLVNRAREIIRDGTLGRLVAVTGQWNMRKHVSYYEQDWRKRWQAGPVLTNLIHDMDLLRYMVGDVVSLSAEVSNAVQGFEKEDAAAIVMRFDNGVLGSFMLSDQTHSPWGWESATGENLGFPRIGENAMHFMGTEGSLEFPNLKLWRSQEGVADWRNSLQPELLSGALEDAYIEQITHFVNVIQKRSEPRVDAADAAQTLRTILAVYDAAESGARVYLGQNAD